MDEEKKKILIVEDDVFVRDIYNLKFNSEGFEVILAMDGREALARLTEAVPDIILLDIIMPYMDGMEVLDHFTENRPDTTVVVLTGYGTIETAVQAVKRGAFDYLTKPAKLDEILLILKRAEELKELKAENVLLRS